MPAALGLFCLAAHALPAFQAAKGSHLACQKLELLQECPWRADGRLLKAHLAAQLPPPEVLCAK